MRALKARFERDTLGQPTFPLAVLTATYFFDEFDTAAFATLAPDIQRSFGLSDERFIGLVVLNLSIVILLAVPLGHLADRVSRVRLVVLSGILAGTFSLATGLATSVALLAIARFGNGLGLLANQPVHNSLLADYYTPEARPTAFATHANALYVGGIAGPAVAGIAGAVLGWRAAFFILFIPIVVVTVIASRLQDPARGATDPGIGALTEPSSFREACRILWRIRTLRRIFVSIAVLGAGIIPLIAMMPLFLEREFGLGPLARGAIGALNAVCTYIGVQRAGRSVPRWFAQGAAVPMRKVGLTLTMVGPTVMVTSASPWLAMALVSGGVGGYFSGYFYAPLAAVQALVSPAAERTLSFSLGAIFMVLGVGAFFASGLGSISDAHGIRWGLFVLGPFFLAGGALAATAGRYVEADLATAFAPSSTDQK